MLKYSVSQIEVENNPVTVNILKKLLNETILYQKNPLSLNGKIDRDTLLRAYEVSILWNLGDEYGNVGINTFSYLAKKNPRIFSFSNSTIDLAWIQKLALFAATENLIGGTFDIETFLTLYKENFKIYLPYGDAWEANFKRFVEFLFADPALGSTRWASYMLATAMHEGRAAADKWKATWNPVSESGGASKDYGALETVTNWSGQPIDADGNVINSKNPARPIQQRYYGRGYIQITHQENYRAMDEALNLNGALHRNPDLAARDAQVSYNILSYGMIKGSFRGSKRRVEGKGYIGGHKLSDYLNETATDYVAARDIVNGGRDKAELIAGYARTFKNMFDVSFR